MVFSGSGDVIVELTAVELRYGDVVALRGVDLTVARGRRTVLAGPNGAGKSSLLETIAGIRRPHAGRVRRVAAAVAFVPQRTAVSDRLPLTVRDVVAIGGWVDGMPGAGVCRRRRRIERSRVDEAMSRTDVAHLARRGFAELSGGQRQRTLLAQGIAGRADLLLLDEPTTGLDDDSAARIRRVVGEESARGAAVVCVSHDPDLLAAADRLVRLAEGRIVR
jgi:zinc/manganese transport system ATP-binding protein